MRTLRRRVAAGGDPADICRLRRQLVRAGAGEDDAGLCRACHLMVPPESGECPSCDLGFKPPALPPWLTVHQPALALAVEPSYVECLADAGRLEVVAPRELSADDLLAVLVTVAERGSVVSAPRAPRSPDEPEKEGEEGQQAAQEGDHGLEGWAPQVEGQGPARGPDRPPL